MVPGSDPQRSFGERPASYRSAEEGTPPDRALLDRVLRETLGSGEPTPEDNRRILQCLAQVAARYPDDSAPLEQVAREMAEAVLRTQFGGTESQWGEVAENVASELCDDPKARGRVEALWKDLRGAKP